MDEGSEKFIAQLAASCQKQIDCGHLRAMFAGSFPDAQRMSKKARDKTMVDALMVASSRGIIKLPPQESWSKSTKNISLPQHVALVHSRAEPFERIEFLPEDNEAEEAGFKWHPKLRDRCANFSGANLQAAQLVSAWLDKNPVTLPSPLNERSLEIFGDEKFLAKKLHNDHLFGCLHISELDAYHPPMLLQCRPGPVPGRNTLIVENYHTYWSIANWNEESAYYSGVAFGNGINVTNADLGFLLKESGGKGLVYFGDLDPAGFDIVRRLGGKNECCKPAEKMYAFLLRRGHRRALKAKADPPLREWLKAWLPHLAQEILDLWESGLWIPQESLGTQQLAWEFGDFQF